MHIVSSAKAIIILCCHSISVINNGAILTKAAERKGHALVCQINVKVIREKALAISTLLFTKNDMRTLTYIRVLKKNRKARIRSSNKHRVQYVRLAVTI